MTQSALRTEPLRLPAKVAAAALHPAFSIVRGERRVRLMPKFGNGVREVLVRYLWAGAPGAPSFVVQGGISATREVCADARAGSTGWWEALVGAGHALDLDAARVLSIDWVASDALGAPAVSSEDQADIIAALADALGITRIAGFIGASYGAMVGLAFAVRHGARLGRLLAIAGAHRPHPLASAQRAIQRGIVRLGLEHDCAESALSLARQLALTTYRGREEFSERFRGEAEWQDGRFRLPVEAWLEHHGSAFVGRFDSARYLALSESIDLHRIDPAAVRVPTTLVGFSTDLLVPLGDLCELQRGLGAPSSVEAIDSSVGHDGFLKEYARLAPIVRDFCRDCGV